MDLEPMFVKLWELEREVAAAAVAANAKDKLRVYEWMPTSRPETPCIFNWIDDGSYDLVDTARADDLLIVTATIGVAPNAELTQLVRLTDVFRRVVDPALFTRPVLEGTAKSAKRLVSRTAGYDFNGLAVMGMDMLIQVQLPHVIG
jgi:hypothetical protein